MTNFLRVGGCLFKFLHPIPIKKKYKSHELELQQVFVGERYEKGMTLQEAPINKCQVIIKQEQFKSFNTFNTLKTVSISILHLKTGKSVQIWPLK